MDLGIQGRVALITGASKGIGKAAAEELAKEGCKIVICARHANELNEFASELRANGVEVLAIPADMTQDSDIKNWSNRQPILLER